jgi:hypothetical protein
MARHTERADGTWSRRTLLRTAGALGTGAVASTGTAAAGRGRGSQGGGGGDQSRSLGGRLRGIGAGTYSFVREFADENTGLVPDRVDVEDGEPIPGDRTSPANVGVQMLATVGANEMGLLSDEAAVSRLDTVLSTLEGLETWNGLFRRWYDVETGDLHDSESAPNVSTIDNGWLSAGLVVVKQAFEELADRAGALVAGQDYGELYKEEVYDLFEGEFTSPGFLHAKYDPNEGGLVGTFGALNAETRIAYYVAIGKGDIPEGTWWQMYRTFPPGEDFSWTNQDPEGVYRTYQTPDFGPMEVYEGHYTYLGTTYVPSWGGSMFEALMPSLVVKEPELGAQNFAVNNRRHARLQVEHAAEQGYDAWGFSPAATPDGYGIFGVNQLGISGYDREDYVTPHATFLALEYLDDDVLLENVTQFQQWGARGDYGFYDSVELETGDPTTSYLVLDQGMSMAAIANRLTGGALRERFHADPIADAAEEFLTTEQFSI